MKDNVIDTIFIVLALILFGIAIFDGIQRTIINHKVVIQSECIELNNRYYCIKE
ncbi:MAG: hypothetical protein LIR50_07110 [Bacillota bacterium]|nr:hypothetical protein [Bacillota bacterium]